MTKYELRVTGECKQNLSYFHIHFMYIYIHLYTECD